MVKKEIDITRWTEEEEDVELEGEEGGRRENGSKDAERKKTLDSGIKERGREEEGTEEEERRRQGIQTQQKYEEEVVSRSSSGG